MTPKCPSCDKPLKPITYPSHSYLNKEQWESIKGGDWYCDKCDCDGHPSGHTLFWNRDLIEFQPEETISIAGSLESLRTENAELRQRAETTEKRLLDCEETLKQACSARGHYELRAKLDKARAALEPFAAVTRQFKTEPPDSLEFHQRTPFGYLSIFLTLGHCRAAKAALDETK